MNSFRFLVTNSASTSSKSMVIVRREGLRLRRLKREVTPQRRQDLGATGGGRRRRRWLAVGSSSAAGHGGIDRLELSAVSDCQRRSEKERQIFRVWRTERIEEIGEEEEV